MVASGTIHRLYLTSLVCVPFAVSSALIQPALAQKQPPAVPAQDPTLIQPDLTDPNNLRPLTQDGSLLSMQGGQRLVNEATSAVGVQKYPEAAKKLQQARQVFNQLSNFYQQLFSSFSGIDNRLAEEHRKKAVDTAQMRDEATYQLALVHRAQNQAELAVPLLIQIIRSQNPTRDLGKKAYQQLLELGFVSDAYPSAPGSRSTSSSSPKALN